MANGEVRVEGGRRLRASLRRAGDDMQDLKVVHKDAADIAADEGRREVPVDTGGLKATIRASGTKTAAIIRAGTKRVAYALPIHWGWPKRDIEANPFLSAGAQQSEPRWIRVYQSYVERTINRIEGR